MYLQKNGLNAVKVIFSDIIGDVPSGCITLLLNSSIKIY